MIETTGPATAPIRPALPRATRRATPEIVLALSSSNPRRALAIARREFARGGPADRIERGRLLRAYAHALRAVGEYGAARASYRQARRLLAAAGAELEHAICALGLVDACMYLGRYHEAFAVADEARRVFVRHRDTARLAKLETNLGNLHHRLEALEPALAHYERAAQLFAERGASPLELASIDHNRANVLIHMGRRHEAEALFERARDAFQAAGEPVIAAQASYGLACLHFLSGDYALAIAELENVRPVLTRLGARALLALADLDLAEMLGAMRLHTESLALGREAERWFRRHRLPVERARCDLVVGSALAHLGDWAAAKSPLLAAQRTLRSQGHAPGEAMVELARGRFAMLAGQPGDAARHALRARGMFARAGFRTRALAAASVAVEAMLAARRHEQARALARRLLLEPQTPGDAYSRARLARVDGAASAQLGETEAALRGYRNALAESARINSALFVDEWRVGFMDGEPALLDEYMGALLSRRHDPDPEQVWRWLARARASLGASGRARAPKTSAALASKCAELQGELEACYARLNRTWPQERGRAGRFATRETEQRALQLETRLRRLAAVPVPAPATTLRGRSDLALSPDELQIGYFSAYGRLGAVCRSGRQWWMVRDIAAMSEVDRELRLFHYHMNARGLGDAVSRTRELCGVERAGAHLARLSTLLLSPLDERAASARKLRVLPCGGLFRVPFPALPFGAGLLQNRFEVSLAVPPGPRAEPGRRGACVIGFGDPERDNIEAEARSVAEVLEGGGVDVSLYLGGAARRQVVVEAVRRSAVLHLCGHGMFRAQHPEFSALRLADGWLSARELVTLPLAGVTAVLSGCETGTRAVAAGDEALGLSRGLVRAGAAAVVCSLWRVDDRATSTLMTGLYRHWRASGTLGAGLRAVQLERASEVRDPYLWAAFGLIGDAAAAWPVSGSSPLGSTLSSSLHPSLVPGGSS
jgi:tetratricopeptide (TPR) repeat protein